MNFGYFLLTFGVIIQTWSFTAGLKASDGDGLLDAHYSKDRRLKSRKTLDLEDFQALPRSSSVYHKRYHNYHYYKPNRHNQFGSPLLVLEAKNNSHTLFNNHASPQYQAFFSNYNNIVKSQRERPSVALTKIKKPSTTSTTTALPMASSRTTANGVEDLDMSGYLSSIYKKNNRNKLSNNISKIFSEALSNSTHLGLQEVTLGETRSSPSPINNMIKNASIYSIAGSALTNLFNSALSSSSPQPSAATSGNVQVTIDSVVKSSSNISQERTEPVAIRVRSTSTTTTTTKPPNINVGNHKDPISDGHNLSLMSSAVNVIDGDENSTQLAHSILVVKQRRPTTPSSLSSSSFTSTTAKLKPNYQTRSTTETYLTPFHTNHRPQTIKPIKDQPWYRPPEPSQQSNTISTPKPSSSLSSFSFQSSPSNPFFPSSSSSSATNSLSSTVSSSTSSHAPHPSKETSSLKPSPFFDDVEAPILMSNNHRKTPYNSAIKNKLTTEYANFWTTPSTLVITDRFSLKKPSSNRPSMIFANRPSSLSSNSNKPASFISSSSSASSSSITSSSYKPHLQVSYIKDNKHKKPDRVVSNTLTVLGGDSNIGIRPAPNLTTVLHKNVIVAYKPGRPRPDQSSTTASTQYPIYSFISTKWPHQNYTPFIVSSSSTPITDRVSLPWSTWTSDQEVTTSNPQATSKSPADLLDDLDTMTMSSIHRPTIAIFGKPPHRPLRPLVSVPSIEVPTRYPLVTNHVTLSITPATVSYNKNDSSICKNSCGSDLDTGDSEQTFLVTATTSATPTVYTTLPPIYPFSDLETTKRPTDGFVHAIYAPPMPSRPMMSSPPPAQNNALLALFGVDSLNGLFTRLSIFKALLFTALIILLPPLTLMAAVSSVIG